MSSYTIDHKYRGRYASTKKRLGSSNIAILLGLLIKQLFHSLVRYEIVLLFKVGPIEGFPIIYAL